MSYEVVIEAEQKNASEHIKIFSNSIEKEIITIDANEKELITLNVGINKAVYNLDITVVAISREGYDAASYRIYSCVKNLGNNTLCKVGADNKNIMEDIDEWDVSVKLIGNSIVLVVKGEPNKKIYWKAFFRYVNYVL